MLTLISNHWLSGLLPPPSKKTYFPPNPASNWEGLSESLSSTLVHQRWGRIWGQLVGGFSPTRLKNMRTSNWSEWNPKDGVTNNTYLKPPPRLILLRGRIFGKLANNQPSKWDHLLHIYFHLPTFSFQVSLFVRKVFLFEAKLCGFIWEIPPSRVVLEICLSSILDMEGANQKLE